MITLTEEEVEDIERLIRIASWGGPTDNLLGLSAWHTKRRELLALLASRRTSKETTQ